MNQDLCYRSATELARLIGTKEVSPVEVVRAHLERIEAVNPRVNAIVTMNARAEEQARAAEAAVIRGDELGPLHGVPFTVKDSLDTAGIRTTRGSRLFTDHVPCEDATAVSRLKAAGAILLGKTNVPEFSFARETENRVFGRTLNPWDPDRTPGGSSGGEAAAISSGLSPIGVGSDVALSIRAPAHYCGIVGLKATHGRIPLTGHWPEVLRRFWHVGPMARTVRDVALAMNVMAGPDGHDPYSLPVPPPWLIDPEPRLSQLRIGWLAERGFGPVDADVVSTVAHAAEVLRDFGCLVESAPLPGLEDQDCNTLTATLFQAEAGAYFESIVAGRRAELHPVLRRYLDIEPPSLSEYLVAGRELERLRHDVAEYFRDHDVLLCPVSPVSAFPHDMAQIQIAGATLPTRHVVRPTVPFNVTGSPALSVPFGWSREGLPIGVQVVGRHFDEVTVLRVGMALESAAGAAVRRPVLELRNAHDALRVQ